MQHPVGGSMHGREGHGVEGRPASLCRLWFRRMVRGLSSTGPLGSSLDP